VAVLSNPPTTSGARTLARVELARELLGFESSAIVNLFPLPTFRSGEIARAGKDSSTWLAGRFAIDAALRSADGVLLAYGSTPPSGPARLHFQSQVSWMHTVMAQIGLLTWMVGNRPAHPSRWQRHTHACHPNIPFKEALAHSLVVHFVPSRHADPLAFEGD